jgi:valyl-tRNA synthetase
MPTTGQSGHGAAGQQGQGQGQGGEQDLVQHAKHATGEIVNQVQQQASTQIDRQKESAANDLSQVVSAVRRFGESLGAEQGGPIARYAAEYGDKAAQKLEQFAGYIREQDARRLLDDVQNFGRRRPGLMLGGAFLLGLAGARLIRSSMDAGMQQSGGQQHSLHTNMTTPRTGTGSNISAAPSSPSQGAI